MSLQILSHKCPKNHPCPAVHICPLQALSQEGNAAPTVDQERCVDCGKCTRFCPTGALQLEA